MKRNLAEVIEEVLKVAPDLQDSLFSVLQSAKFAAPENMVIHWKTTTDILNTNASNHPKKAEIVRIFNGS